MAPPKKPVAKKGESSTSQWHADTLSTTEKQAERSLHKDRLNQVKEDEKNLYGSLTGENRADYIEGCKTVADIERYISQTAYRTQWFSMDEDARKHWISVLDETSNRAFTQVNASPETRVVWEKLIDKSEDAKEQLEEMHEGNWKTLIKKAQEKHAPAILTKKQLKFVMELGEEISLTRKVLNKLPNQETWKRAAEWRKRPAAMRERSIKVYGEFVLEIRQHQRQSAVTQIWDDLETCAVRIRKEAQILQRECGDPDFHDANIDREYPAKHLDDIPVNTTWKTATKPSGLSPTLETWLVEDLMNLQRRIARIIDSRLETEEQNIAREEAKAELMVRHGVTEDQLEEYEWKFEPTRNSIKYKLFQAQKPNSMPGHPSIRKVNDPGPNNAQMYNMNQKLQNDHQRVMVDPATFGEAQIPTYIGPARETRSEIPDSEGDEDITMGEEENEDDDDADTEKKGDDDDDDSGDNGNDSSDSDSDDEHKGNRKPGTGRLVDPENVAEVFGFVPDFRLDGAPSTLFSEMLMRDEHMDNHTIHTKRIAKYDVMTKENAATARSKLVQSEFGKLEQKWIKEAAKQSKKDTKSKSDSKKRKDRDDDNGGGPDDGQKPTKKPKGQDNGPNDGQQPAKKTSNNKKGTKTTKAAKKGNGSGKTRESPSSKGDSDPNTNKQKNSAEEGDGNTGPQKKANSPAAQDVTTNNLGDDSTAKAPDQNPNGRKVLVIRYKGTKAKANDKGDQGAQLGKKSLIVKLKYAQK